MRILKTFFILLIFMGTAVSSVTAETTTLAMLLSEADQNNPALLAAKEQISVAFARIDQVSSLQDPILAVSLSNYPVDSLKSSRTPMTGNEIRLSQKFPFPGKLDQQGKIAAEKSQWFEAVYQDARLQIRTQVKDAWYRLLFQRQAIELTKRNLTLLDDFIKLTETRYEVGRGLQQNVLKAHLERSKQLDKLINLQQQEEATIAEINSLSGRETDHPLKTDNIYLTGLNRKLDLEQLRQTARESRPMFAAYNALIEQYKAQRQLAKLDYRPDFTLWTSYRWRDDNLPDDGTDFISAGISFNLPVRREKRAAAVAEADSSLRLARQKRNDFNNQVNLTIHRALTNYQQASELAALYQNGIILRRTRHFRRHWRVSG